VQFEVASYSSALKKNFLLFYFGLIHCISLVIHEHVGGAFDHCPLERHVDDPVPLRT